MNIDSDKYYVTVDKILIRINEFLPNLSYSYVGEFVGLSDDKFSFPSWDADGKYYDREQPGLDLSYPLETLVSVNETKA